MKEETKQKIREYYKNEPKEKKEERIRHIKENHALKKRALQFYIEAIQAEKEKEERKQQYRELFEKIKEKGYRIVKDDNITNTIEDLD